jgi:hypothetical protein
MGWKHHDVYMRTTVTLDDDLAAQLQDLSARLRKPFKEVINDAIRKGLPGAGKPPKIKPFKVKSWNLQLRPGYEGVNYNTLNEELMIEEYLEKERRSK